MLIYYALCTLYSVFIPFFLKCFKNAKAFYNVWSTNYSDTMVEASCTLKSLNVIGQGHLWRFRMKFHLGMTELAYVFSSIKWSSNNISSKQNNRRSSAFQCYRICLWPFMIYASHYGCFILLRSAGMCIL